MYTPQKLLFTPKSPALIFLAVAVSVFFSEAFVMLLLQLLPRQSFPLEALMDALLMVVFASPALYYLLFLPLVTHFQECQQTKDTLLENKEERFRIMIRASLDGFWITDVRGRFLEVNNAYCQLMGYSQEELLNMGISDVDVTEDAQDIVWHTNKVIETGNDRFEARHRCKDGRLLDIAISASYGDLNGGEIYYFLHDITERKQVEAELKLSGQILNSISDTVFLFDHDGNFVYLNKVAWNSRGYTREEMMAMNLRTLNQPEYNKLLASRIKEMLEKGVGFFESAHRCKDGTIMPVEVNACIYEAGDRRLILTVVRDITERIRLESSLLESEEKFRSISTHTHDALIMMDNDGNVSFWNAAAEKIFGYPAQEVMGKELHAFLVPKKYYEAFQKGFRHFRETGKGAMIGQSRELTALRKGGAEFPVELSMAALKLKNKWNAVCVIRDITERKLSEEILRENESRLKDMFEHLSSGVAIYHASADGKDFIFTAFNQAAERIDNMRRDDLIGRNALEVFPALAEFGLIEVFRRVWLSGNAEHFPVSFYHNGRIGGWRDNYVYKLPNGEIVAIYNDVTKEKQADERIHYLAHYDALTGLPNRELFTDRLKQALVLAKRDKTRAALLFIDLDNFKPVNDDFGHAVGDMLLKEVALRMRNCVRDSDTVSRIGGDEFVILLPSIDAEQNAMREAENILYALNLPFELAGHVIQVSSSIGVAVYPEHGGNEKLLTRNADAAMYYAKSAGRNNVKLYQPDMVIR